MAAAEATRLLSPAETPPSSGQGLAARQDRGSVLSLERQPHCVPFPRTWKPGKPSFLGCMSTVPNVLKQRKRSGQSSARRCGACQEVVSFNVKSLGRWGISTGPGPVYIPSHARLLGSGGFGLFKGRVLSFVTNVSEQGLMKTPQVNDGSESRVLKKVAIPFLGGEGVWTFFRVSWTQLLAHLKNVSCDAKQLELCFEGNKHSPHLLLLRPLPRLQAKDWKRSSDPAGLQPPPFLTTEPWQACYRDGAPAATWSQ